LSYDYYLNFINYVIGPSRPALDIQADYIDAICFEDLMKQHLEWQSTKLKKVLDRIDTYVGVTGPPGNGAQSDRDNIEAAVANIDAAYIPYYNSLLTAESTIYDFPTNPQNTSGLRTTLSTQQADFKLALEALETLLGGLEGTHAQGFLTFLLEQDDIVKAKCKTITSKITFLRQLCTDKKEVFNSELEDSEYKFKSIGKLREKCLKLIDDYYTDYKMWIRSSLEVVNQNRLFKTSVNVIGGDKFPQDTTCQIELNGLVLEGTFSGNTFSISRYLPKYIDISLE
jgi:hypothetical protein